MKQANIIDSTKLQECCGCLYCGLWHLFKVVRTTGRLDYHMLFRKSMAGMLVLANQITICTCLSGINFFFKLMAYNVGLTNVVY